MLCAQYKISTFNSAQFKTITQLRKSSFDSEQSATLFFKLWSPDIFKFELKNTTFNHFYALIHHIVIKIKVQFCHILQYCICYLFNSNLVYPIVIIIYKECGNKT